jgi:hypothetical protein
MARWCGLLDDVADRVLGNGTGRRGRHQPVAEL